MVDITIEPNPELLANVRRKCGNLLDESKLNKAYNAAAKRAADSAKAEIKRQITARYTVKSGHVGSTIKTQKNQGNGAVGAAVRIQDSPIQLPKFGGTNPKKPLKKRKPQRVHIKLDNSAFITTNWFPAQMKSGHVGIFKRVAINERTGKKRRLPISEIYGPATPGMFKNEEIVEAVTKYTQEVFDKRFQHEIERLLNSS